MYITRHNYEAYFLLYVDNELSVAGRRTVEAFVQQNADLEKELIMLQQSVLQPDEKVVFVLKEKLIKGTARQDLVNENNYEEYFVLYGDEELSNEEKDQVEQFVYRHPQYQAEFELMQQARIFPDNTIIFPGKACLHHTEKDNKRVVLFGQWHIAAAVVVLAIVCLSLYIANRDHNNAADGSSMAVTKNTSPSTDTTTVSGTSIKAESKKYFQPATENHSTAVVKEKKNIANPRNIIKGVNVSPEKTQEITVQTQVTDSTGLRDTPDTYLPARPVASGVASYTEKPATGIVPKPIREQVPVTATAAVMPEEKNGRNIYILNTAVNKTPLRGFFRKVSRVVEKVTCLELDENNKGGVRIANFELALK